MSATFVLPRQTLFGANGLVAPLGSVRFFLATTSTPKTVYSDTALTIPIAQPIQADSAGRLPKIYIATGSYKVIYYSDAAGTIAVYTEDNCDTGIPAGSGALPVASGGTGATTAAGARTNLAAASQTDLNTQAAALAVIQAAIAALPSGALNDLAGLDFLTRAYLAAGFGSIAVQRSEIASTTAVATCAGLIPYDNTRPQNTEGTQVMTGSITPKSATSELVVRVEVDIGTSAADNICVSLFQDTTADAIGARWFTLAAATYIKPVSFEVRVPSVGVAATAFKVRVGGASNTTYINGISTGRIGGDTIKSSIHVTEWASI